MKNTKDGTPNRKWCGKRNIDMKEEFENALYEFVGELYESHTGDGEKDGQIDYFITEKWKDKLYELANKKD